MPIIPEQLTGRERDYRIVCKGLGKEELYEFYRDIRNQIPDGRVSFRNPFPPHFEPSTIHEIWIGVGLAAYPAKKLIDLVADIAKRILEKREDEKRRITIYDDRGKPYLIVKGKATKRK